jgi:hypothetical protein
LASTACVHVPPEIAQAHLKENEIIKELQRSHIAMVDAFIAAKRDSFDQFFFAQYEPAYQAH